MVEAKVINIGFNRVTLRSQKGNEATYAFNSDKFLKWFNKVPLTEHMRLHAENKKADILDGVKVITSGPSVKERTSTPKEKEDKFKLSFGFKDKDMTSFEIVAEAYTLGERKSRLGTLLSPMHFGDNGNQASTIILTALHYAKDLKHHSDAEWRAMIDSRDEEKCDVTSLDNLDRYALTLFCNVIEAYALKLEGYEEVMDLSPSGFWAVNLPKNKNEVLFIAQLLCDGGINKYDLTCAGLTENLLKDNRWTYGMRDVFYDDEGNVVAEGDEATALKLKSLENEGEAE